MSTGRSARCEHCCGHSRLRPLPTPLPNKVGTRGCCRVFPVWPVFLSSGLGGCGEAVEVIKEVEKQQEKQVADGEERSGDCISSELLPCSGPTPFTAGHHSDLLPWVAWQDWPPQIPSGTWARLTQSAPVHRSSFQCSLGSAAPILHLLSTPFPWTIRNNNWVSLPSRGWGIWCHALALGELDTQAKKMPPAPYRVMCT